MSSVTTIPQNGDPVELSAFGVQVSPTTLIFGSGTDPAPIDKTVTHELKLKNTRSSSVWVSVAPVVDAKDSLKYNLAVDHPVPFVVDGEGEQTVRVAIRVLCTTRLAIEISLKTWHDNDVRFKETKLKISVESEASTKLDPDELRKDTELGEGGFGVVFSGTYRGREVAIKMPKNREFFKTEDQISFDREVNMMEKWRHETIVEFVGAVIISGKQAIVTELCPFGSLDNAMEKHLDKFDERMKVKCLLNTSDAMNFLHSNGVMHRDLKPENLLVVSLNWRDSVVVKLTDFGTTRAEKRIQETHMKRISGKTKTLNVGTSAYMAPEVSYSKEYDKSVDVYSFAMLMYTIFSDGISPFEDKTLSGKDPYGKVISGKRPSIPSSCSEDIAKLMKLCWDGTPSKRPKFDRIHAFFEEYFLECRYGKEGAKAIPKAGALLNKMPQLESEEELVWISGGGTDYEHLCELLKANTIPTKRLEFKGLRKQ